MLFSAALSLAASSQEDPLEVLVDRVLKHDHEAVAELASVLLPDIQLAVVWELQRWLRGGRNALQERNDMVQMVFLELIENDVVLRNWAPQRGSLRRYIQGVAKRKVRNELRTKRGRPLSKAADAQGDLEAVMGSDRGLEGRLLARDQLNYLVGELNKRLSVEGQRRFRQIFVEKRSIKEVSAELGVPRNTIDRWVADVRKLVRRLAREHGLDVDGEESTHGAPPVSTVKRRRR